MIFFSVVNVYAQKRNYHLFLFLFLLVLPRAGQDGLADGYTNRTTTPTEPLHHSNNYTNQNVPNRTAPHRTKSHRTVTRCIVQITKTTRAACCLVCTINNCSSREAATLNSADHPRLFVSADDDDVDDDTASSSLPPSTPHSTKHRLFRPGSF